MKVIFFLIAFISAVALVACEDDTERFHTYHVTYVFGLRGQDPAIVRFEATTQDTAVIRMARQELNRSIADRHLFPSGPIEAYSYRDQRLIDESDLNRLIQNHREYLYLWSWRFVPSEWTLVESAIELCDGTPGMVDSNLAYWVDTVGQFCPWQAYVLQEILPAPDRIVH